MTYEYPPNFHWYDDESEEDDLEPESAETVPRPEERQKATATALNETRRTDIDSGNLEQVQEASSELENAETGSRSEGHEVDISTTLNVTHETPVASSGYQEYNEAWDEFDSIEPEIYWYDESEEGSTTTLDSSSQTVVASSGYGAEVEASSELHHSETPARFQQRNQDITTTMEGSRPALIDYYYETEIQEAWAHSEVSETEQCSGDHKEITSASFNGTSQAPNVSCRIEDERSETGNDEAVEDDEAGSDNAVTTLWDEELKECITAILNGEEALWSKERKESIRTDVIETLQEDIASCIHEKNVIWPGPWNVEAASFSEEHVNTIPNEALQALDASCSYTEDETTQVVAGASGASEVRPEMPISFHRHLKDMDLNEFVLQPMPDDKCSPELEKMFDGFHKRVRNGWDADAFIQSHKYYSNPSTDEELFKYCGIDEAGTNYPPEMGSEPSWGLLYYYDALAALEDEALFGRCPQKKDAEWLCNTHTEGPSRKRRKTNADLPPTPSTPPELALAPSRSTDSSDSSLSRGRRGRRGRKSRRRAL